MATRQEVRSRILAELDKLTPQQLAQLAPLMQAVNEAMALADETPNQLLIRLLAQAGRNRRRELPGAVRKAIDDLIATDPS